jgi:xylulokinase
MYDSYYPCYLHAREGTYFTFSLNHTGGILLKWWRDNFAQEEVRAAKEAGITAYALMDKHMPDGPAPVMVLPHLNGSGTPHCDLHAKGAIVGLTLATTRHEIAKALLESLSFELRINLERLAACGIPVEDLRAAGGGAGSARWLQLKSNILNRPVRTLRCKESACLGAALLAGVAVRHWSSLGEAVEQTVQFSAEFLPQKDAVLAYDERYALYKTLYPALLNLNERL